MLDLAGNGFGSAGTDAFGKLVASGKLESLIELNLSHNDINRAEAQNLGQALTHGNLINLAVLNLSNNDIGHEGVLAFAHLMSSGKIPHLSALYLAYRFNSVPVADETKKAVADILAPGRLPFGEIRWYSPSNGYSDLRKSGFDTGR